MALEPTVAAPPNTQEIVSQALATMAALNGVLTDYNTGSQIRTMLTSESSVIEQQGAWVQAAAFQALMYGAMNAFGIVPFPAFKALGFETFATSAASGGGPLATQNVIIPSGTVVQTPGGTQFQTSVSGVLASGTSGVSLAIQAVSGGSGGNVPAGSITQIITSVLYPVFVTNSAAVSGGAEAESLSQTISRFAAAVGAIGRSTPVAIANSAIGVIDLNTNQVVQYATCFEPWVAAGSGAGSGTAGWTLYLDNGFGSASSGLIAAVTSKLNGNLASGLPGYRDAGVPFGVSGVVPTYADVSVTGIVSSLTTSAAVSGLLVTAISGYFTLPFGAPAQQAILAQTVGNAVLGLMDTLTVNLFASGSLSGVSSLSTPVSGRIVLNKITLSLA